MRAPAVLALTAVLLAGCLTTPGADDAASAPLRLVAGGATFAADVRQGGLSELRLVSGSADGVTFPAGVLVVQDGRLLPPGGSVVLSDAVRFLPPYGAAAIEVTVDAQGSTHALTLPLAAGAGLASGDLAVELMKIQRSDFPHRMPGHESYRASQGYFAEWFAELGYEVEVDPYGTMALDAVKVPAGRGWAPSSVANVVATKKGTLDPPRYIVFGGHYDVVENTVEGAFDNTAGTVATMAVAKAFAEVETEHTLVFGLWGGEEDGILGSAFWVNTNPDLVPFIDGYYNFDIPVLTWPAPANSPAAIVLAAGPDGPQAERLHAQAAEIASTYLLTGAQWIPQGVVAGQAAGAGVNAQSDSTAFMRAGIPVYFTFTERVDHVRTMIHKPSDTLENATKYALEGLEGIGREFTPEQMAEGERVLARSFEVHMALAIYWALLVDAGVFESPTLGKPGFVPPTAALPAP